MIVTMVNRYNLLSSLTQRIGEGDREVPQSEFVKKTENTPHVAKKGTPESGHKRVSESELKKSGR